LRDAGANDKNFLASESPLFVGRAVAALAQDAHVLDRSGHLCGSWKTRPGRPSIPADLQRLIVTMARANPTWGEERIANELLLKLGLVVSPRTIGRYLRHRRPPRGGRPSQRWATFVRNHATAVLACDFFITVTACFRVLYVFVVLDVGTRRIVHWNVAEHPTAEWTIQQFRMSITGERPHRYLVHDRDGIFASALDHAVASMGLRGPGLPEPPPPSHQPHPAGHHLPAGHRIEATPILAGLHHEYRLVEAA